MSSNGLRVFAYSQRKDETEYFKKFSAQYGIDLGITTETPSLDNIGLANGYPCVSIITTPITSEMVDKFRAEGVRFISTRTIGYDHIDLDRARSAGMRIGNAPYSPGSVAGYTVMLMLMATRRMKAIDRAADAQDFTLKGLQGIELRNLTVGVAGTGRIGRTVIDYLSGFGCRIIAYDLYQNEEVKKRARYVGWDEFLAESDLITLHMPATADNYHMVNKESIARMKDGVFIINTARGALIDSADFIDAVESGKIGGAALDVTENEDGLYYFDLRGQPIRNRELAILRSFPNVIVTPHTAFYTDQAVSDMVENSLRSCAAFLKGEDNPWEIRL